jgi:H+/Cl- antiporter ClcA
MIVYLFPLLAIVAGLMAASSVVIERMPNAREVVQKLAPYQATIGLVTLVLGVFFFVDMISGSMSALRSAAASTKLVATICFASAIVVGFLQGYPLVEKYILNDAEAATHEKVDNFRKKLVPFQVIAGLAAMITGGLTFLSMIF